MKKLFAYVSAVIFAVNVVSCQKASVVKPGEGNVTFSIQTPGVATKAIGDGTNVNVVYYEIYKAEDNHKNSINGGTPLIDGTAEVTTKIVQNETVTSATLSFNLLEDQDYVALFWAQVDGKPYYNVEDLRAVTVNYVDQNGDAYLANEEARAAFCQVHEFSTAAAYSETVRLERPFAQLNLGTTLESLDKDYRIELQESKIEVKGVGTTYNVAKMTTAGTRADVVFDFAAVPSQTLEVSSVEYAYAGMNYFLVPADASTVELDYYIKTDVGTVHRAVSQVPVMKNYRTNIIGNLLTTTAQLEIVIDDEFKTPANDIVNN